MAHGPAERPIESRDGHDLAIDRDGIAPVLDAKTAQLLRDIVAVLAETNRLLAKSLKEKPALRSVALPVVTVASLTTHQVFLEPTSDRTGAILYNSSTATLYVLIGPGEASSTRFTYTVLTNTTLELPPWAIMDRISGAWAAANGSVLITEFVRLR